MSLITKLIRVSCWLGVHELGGNCNGVVATVSAVLSKAQEKIPTSKVFQSRIVCNKDVRGLTDTASLHQRSCMRVPSRPASLGTLSLFLLLLLYSSSILERRHAIC